MVRCFTCHSRINGEPDFIRGNFNDTSDTFKLPVCSRECVESCEWVSRGEE